MLSVSFVISLFQETGAEEPEIYISLREAELRGGLPELEAFLTPVQKLPLDTDSEIPSRSTVISRAELDRELSRAPSSQHPSVAPGSRGSQFPDGVLALTDPQFQLLIRALRTKTEFDLLSAPSVMARSGQAAFVEVAHLRWAVVPQLRKGEHSIDLEIFLPADGDRMIPKDGNIEPSLRAAMPDGQTLVACYRSGEDLRMTFIRAQLMDPSTISASPNGNHAETRHLTHLAQTGDTLESLASYYGTPVLELLAYNDLENKTSALPSQIRIPLPDSERFFETMDFSTVFKTEKDRTAPIFKRNGQ